MKKAILISDISFMIAIILVIIWKVMFGLSDTVYFVVSIVYFVYVILSISVRIILGRGMKERPD